MRIHSVILAVAMGLMSAASVAGAVGFPNAWQRDAQWVAIVPSGYVADIELLRAYHQSKGMSAVTWKLSDLDLYYGGHGPNEVRAALLEAWQTWAVKPRFVVIATPDAKVSPVPANVIPNFYDTDDEIAGGWGALVPTMMPFMDMNGDNVPEIVVGRLPFSSHLDFVRYYAKVSSHDADTESGMKYRYNGFLLQDVDLDGNSGDWVRDLGNQLMSADPTILRPVLRTSECMGSSMLARDGAIALWNNAPGAVFVLGTAAYWNNLAGFFDLCGTAPWTPSLLGATPGSYPVLVAAICGMGTTDAPVATSCASPNTVAEQLLASSVGSVAVIGPTRTTYQYNNFEFEREVLRVRSEGEHHWGDVYRRALEAMIAKQIGAEDHVREYVYLGDPAVLANATPVSGCPVVDAMSESGWIEENTILGDRATGRLGLDAYRIVSQLDDSGGRCQVRVRENEAEESQVEDVRLVTIEHSAGVVAFLAGDKVRVGVLRAPSRATFRGSDVTSAFAEGGLIAGGPGDTLWVSFGSPADTSRQAPSAFSVTGSFDDGPIGDVIDDGGGKGSGPGVAGLSFGGEAFASIPQEGQLEISGRKFGQEWAAVGNRFPRRRADSALVDTVGFDEVRVVFIAPATVRAIRQLMAVEDSVSVHKCDLLGANHSRLGELGENRNANGNAHFEVIPGDTIVLSFALSACPAGRVRDAFLLTNGAYSKVLPARPLPVALTRPTVLSTVPNPARRGTRMSLFLPNATKIDCRIFDMQGRCVRTFPELAAQSGVTAVDWDGRLSTGEVARPGSYFIRTRVGGRALVSKVVVLP